MAYLLYIYKADSPVLHAGYGIHWEGGFGEYGFCIHPITAKCEILGPRGGASSNIIMRTY